LTDTGGFVKDATTKTLTARAVDRGPRPKKIRAFSLAFPPRRGGLSAAATPLYVLDAENEDLNVYDVRNHFKKRVAFSGNEMEARVDVPALNGRTGASSSAGDDGHGPRLPRRHRRLRADRLSLNPGTRGATSLSQ
jgi:hypothetical protein